MDIITEQANTRAKQFGIQIVDVRIKRIELPREVSTSVYRRMEAERERDAKKLRSQGEAEAVRIRAEADRKRIEVISEAEREAEEIRGLGDAEAADTYAQAYNQNPEFYALYRSLNAYKTAFNDRSDILLIQPNSDFFNYFNQLNGRDRGSPIPIPLSQSGERLPSEDGDETSDADQTQSGDKLPSEDGDETSDADQTQSGERLPSEEGEETFQASEAEQ
jgi:membrane protease subunit HflC